MRKCFADDSKICNCQPTAGRICDGIVALRKAAEECNRLLADNALLIATEQRLRTLLDGADRRAIANGKERNDLAALAADVAGERAANAALTTEIDRLESLRSTLA